MIISFAWTTPALIAGAKTVTRRHWAPQHAAKFRPGQVVQAYDRAIFLHGKAVALIRIESVSYEPLADMPDEDYECEGFAYLHAHPEAQPAKLFGKPVDPTRSFSWEAWDEWRRSGGLVYVVRFSLQDVER